MTNTFLKIVMGKIHCEAELRLEEDNRINVLDKGNSEYSGPKAGLCVVCLRNSKIATVGGD